MSEHSRCLLPGGRHKSSSCDGLRYRRLKRRHRSRSIGATTGEVRQPLTSESRDDRRERSQPILRCWGRPLWSPRFCILARSERIEAALL
jgi:hypothetical protein